MQREQVINFNMSKSGRATEEAMDTFNEAFGDQVLYHRQVSFTNPHMLVTDLQKKPKKYCMLIAHPGALALLFTRFFSSTNTQYDHLRIQI